MILYKAIPMMVMAAGAATNSGKLHGILDHVTTVATQAEINEITKMMILDQIGGEQLPSQEEFGSYLSRNMRVASQSAAGRDVTKDQFGTSYRVEYGTNTVKVTSAGPDKTFDTADDIYSLRKFD